MSAAGPAIRIVGGIRGSADPGQITPENWLERMPLIEGIEILGEHPEADGIELDGTLQATLSRLAIRGARHGIRLVNRNRNVIISDVHLYHNQGIGLFLDHVNLHQINVSNSHISYNRGGGIVVRGGNVRNLQVTGCDLEANMPADETPTGAANILVDQSMPACSAAEIAITGCTIQHNAHYSKRPQVTRLAPGGANIRMLGNTEFQPNMITITGNILSDTETHIHLRHVTDVTISGNTFFTTEPTDVLVEESQRVVIGNCVFNPRESRDTGGVVLRNSQQCLLTGSTLHGLMANQAAVTLEGCGDSRVQGCVISAARNGVNLQDCRNCAVVDCTITGLPAGGEPVIGKLGENLAGELLISND